MWTLSLFANFSNFNYCNYAIFINDFTWSDSIARGTTAATPAMSPNVRVRLFVDGDASTPETGLTMEYQPSDGGTQIPLQRRQLEPSIGAMLVDTILAFFVIRYSWRYPLWLCLFATGFFAIIDVAFFSSTLLKVVDGGWFPLAVGAVVFTVMTTWRRGRGIMFRRLRASSVPLKPFLDSLFVDPPQRVPGTAVFLTATPESTPNALLHNLSHNKVLHERVVFLTAEVSEDPWVSFDKRVQVVKLGHGCWRLTLRFGFMNEPDIVQALEIASTLGLEFDMMATSFFLSRETVVPVSGKEGGMALWREKLFAMMARNAGSAADYFKLPANRVIELGTKVEI